MNAAKLKEVRRLIDEARHALYDFRRDEESLPGAAEQRLAEVQDQLFQAAVALGQVQP